MASKNLAQGESIELELDKVRSPVVAAVSRTGNHAAAVFVLEAQVDLEWVTPLTMVNPIANPKAEIANLTGPAVTGWADLPGYRKCRLRRTDANGAAGWAELNVQAG